jgi:hypothetical protein
LLAVSEVVLRPELQEVQVDPHVVVEADEEVRVDVVAEDVAVEDEAKTETRNGCPSRSLAVW